MRPGLKEMVVMGTLALGGCDGSKQPIPESHDATHRSTQVQDVRQQCREKALATRRDIENFWETGGGRLASWESVPGRTEKECLEEHGAIAPTPSLIEREDDGHGLNGTY